MIATYYSGFGPGMSLQYPANYSAIWYVVQPQAAQSVLAPWKKYPTEVEFHLLLALAGEYSAIILSWAV